MGTTRKDIRQRIGRTGFCGDMLTSTATGGSTSTLVDTSAPVADSTFVGAQIVMLTGNAAGNYRYVTGYSSGTFTVDRNFTSAVANGDTYELHRIFHADAKNEAINAAMLEAKMRWARIVEDTSLTFTVNTFTYNIGNLPVYVDPIELVEKIEYDSGASGTGFPYYPLSPEAWHIRNVQYVQGTAASLILQFDEQINGIIPSGKTIRLTYRVRPATLSNDTTAIAPDEEGFYEFICSKATALLAEKHAILSHEATRIGSWEVVAEKFHARADLLFSRDAKEPQYGQVIVAPSTQTIGYIERPISKIHIPG